MDRYHKNKETVLELNERTNALLLKAEAIVGGSGSTIAQWKLSCANIHQNLVEHVMRIAVVGAIKSGKSTLVNTLLQDDYLKRGAGVVTSIVTRIRRGESLKARLYFKSWDEINADIDQALVLFPSGQWQTGGVRFDIRRIKDRSDLAQALNALDGELKIAKDSLNANSVLLSSYLKGYDQVQGFVEAESTIREFEADDFVDHKKFVGDDALAVYLKDIQLDITNDSLETNIEMADCQGSDSPNPLHMAMIQDYLLKANLIVYVVSSRTGLRQADIRFLSIIKQMGIAGNMLFVCNCDFDEHESLNDLEQLVQKIKEELSMVTSSPQLFILSALYHLFEIQRENLSLRDQNRLVQWGQLNDLTSASNSEYVRLKNELNKKLTRERSSLLLQNQIERLNVVNRGMLNWIRLHRDILQRDTDDANSFAKRIQNHQDSIMQVETIIGGTLDGSIQKISTELKREIDSFFDQHSGPVLQSIVGFIRNHHVDPDRYREQVIDVGFNQALYLAFQEFKQAVDTYMAEKINPDIVSFIGRLEIRLKEYFNSVVDPFEAMVRDAVQQYEKALAGFELEKISGQCVLDTIPDIADIKESIGLQLPEAVTTMRYSAHIKTDAVMRLGFFTLLGMFRKVLKKPDDPTGLEQMNALKGGIYRMKQETVRSVYEHFKDYRENIKFQYVLRLVDATKVRLYEGLTEYFRVYVSDLKEVISTMGSERNDKKQMDEALEVIEKSVHSSVSQIDVLRHDIGKLRGEDTSPLQKSQGSDQVVQRQG
ncbi:MAG: dynamin family protein [Desulfobacteraceae bacterium]|jgi:GTPase SAR1 family protein